MVSICISYTNGSFSLSISTKLVLSNRLINLKPEYIEEIHMIKEYIEKKV